MGFSTMTGILRRDYVVEDSENDIELSYEVKLITLDEYNALPDGTELLFVRDSGSNSVRVKGEDNWKLTFDIKAGLMMYGLNE